MDVRTLLTTETSSGRVALAAGVALAYCGAESSCPTYLAALHQAVKDEPPPFDTAAYADIYRDAALDWRWMAVSLITNAEREGDGAQRLWSLSACSTDEEVRRLLKKHAVDESRHALLYLALLDLTFAGTVEPGFRRELNRLSPGYALHLDVSAVPGSPYAKNASIDDFLQMNIAEIRTAIHHVMQRPALALHTTTDGQRAIQMIQDSLLHDELAHISYTAVLIEETAKHMPFDHVAALFRRRFRDFNQITVDELGEGAFDCSVSCCERHGDCRSKVVSMPDGIPLKLVQ